MRWLPLVILAAVSPLVALVLGGLAARAHGRLAEQRASLIATGLASHVRSVVDGDFRFLPAPTDSGLSFRVDTPAETRFGGLSGDANLRKTLPALAAALVSDEVVAISPLLVSRNSADLELRVARRIAGTDWIHVRRVRIEAAAVLGGQLGDGESLEVGTAWPPPDGTRAAGGGGSGWLGEKVGVHHAPVVLSPEGIGGFGIERWPGTGDPPGLLGFVKTREHDSVLIGALAFMLALAVTVAAWLALRSKRRLVEQFNKYLEMGTLQGVIAGLSFTHSKRTFRGLFEALERLLPEPTRVNPGDVDVQRANTALNDLGSILLVVRSGASLKSLRTEISFSEIIDFGRYTGDKEMPVLKWTGGANLADSPLDDPPALGVKVSGQSFLLHGVLGNLYANAKAECLKENLGRRRSKPGELPADGRSKAAPAIEGVVVHAWLGNHGGKPWLHLGFSNPARSADLALKKILPRIWNADPPTRDKDGRIHLGLWSSAMVTRLMNGKIWARGLPEERPPRILVGISLPVTTWNPNPREEADKCPSPSPY